MSEGSVEAVGEEIGLKTVPVVFDEDFSDAESVYSIQVGCFCLSSTHF